jgi:hypothetical protein
MERISQDASCPGRPDFKDHDHGATVKEFADYAEGYRRDADAEDRTPAHIKEGRSIQ